MKDLNEIYENIETIRKEVTKIQGDYVRDKICLFKYNFLIKEIFLKNHIEIMYYLMNYEKIIHDEIEMLKYINGKDDKNN